MQTQGPLGEEKTPKNSRIIRGEKRRKGGGGGGGAVGKHG